MRDDFAIFILSYGRADRIKTLKVLENGNYKGKWYVVIDNLDETAEEYYKRYGDHVIMFDKVEASKKVDTADNTGDLRAVVYARNVVFDIARDLHLDYFLMLDDDYTAWLIREEEEGKLKSYQVKDLQKLIDASIKYLEESGAKSIAYAQGGDLIGGAENINYRKGILRKAMNVFFCKTERDFPFYGKINEDLTTYVLLGSRGDLFFTITKSHITQVQTQANAGGLTDIYLDLGTYVKSFYSVLYMPSCVKVAAMGEKKKRLHHKVKWENAVPKILEERHKRGWM